ncbi:hypothetical protein BIV57_00920 [Mangrovactinospora gilvigrisea]|uniref:Fluoride-specific ion channel FluC n=1 Tax=Mangrovactinospora gilvigrisea TaxID=1428644 RepID=A0A1J7CCZ4_9ACTN|nr:CrcB family protein [Mangrovactinospora gilvigrisea]OIV39432.1 hypothetical protein BIV57_00920 [Mangrovactinospora gilvigrisea]
MSPPPSPISHVLRVVRLPAVLVVAAGGAVGAAARYGISLIHPTPVTAFPWTTLVINLSGCLMMGVLTVALTERFTRAPRLLDPALGTGVLGGYTTFSTFTDDTRLLFERGKSGEAVADLVLTMGLAPAAVVAGFVLGRVALVRPHGKRVDGDGRRG